MTYSRFDLLKICIKFFVQALLIILLYIIICIVAFDTLKVYGLTIALIGSLGLWFFYGQNLCYVLHDIYNMSIEEFEGELYRVEYSSMRNILPCGVTIINTSKDSRKYHIFHSSKRIDDSLGDLVRLSYLKKSKIIISIEGIKRLNRKRANNKV